MSEIKNDGLTRSGKHSMVYSRTHTSTVDVKKYGSADGQRRRTVMADAGVAATDAESGVPEDGGTHFWFTRALAIARMSTARPTDSWS